MTRLKTSPEGIAFLERHEGVVTRAYRCPAGKWTIGAGLTAASGVVAPKAGMAITRAEARALLGKALGRNYEPAVNREMPEAAQHEFDGGVSFHFNTGAIHKASWIGSWRKRDWPEVERRIKLWKKGGGKVLPGLVRRRGEEFELVRGGRYLPGAATETVDPFAVFAVLVDDAEVARIRKAFRDLGYDPGGTDARILAGAIRNFQRDHDLVVDAKIGKATLSTLQRMLDARAKAAAPVAATAAGGTVEVAQPAATDAVLLPDWLGWTILAGGAVWFAWHLWKYRDAVAAQVQGAAPGLAATLRSI